jgi:hypothetical protein
MSGSDLLALIRADPLVQNRRKADHAAIDLDATKRSVPAVRMERVHRHRPDPTDDKINEAFKRATSRSGRQV